MTPDWEQNSHRDVARAWDRLLREAWEGVALDPLLRNQSSQKGK